MTLPAGFTRSAPAALPLYCVAHDQFSDWRKLQLPAIGQWLDVQRFAASSGTLALLPGEDGIAGAVLGMGDRLDPASYGHAPMALPPGDWRLATELDADARKALLLGWGLGSYRFSRYRKPLREPARLLLDDDADSETLDVLAACVRVRDLVNTPTEDMGPEQMEAVLREIARTHDAQVEAITGEALLEQNYPAIHAVGRASHRAPRLLHLRAGADDAPKLAIVGKGVCFDTGGLNIKAGAGMRNMKKDMGGAAHAIALAELVLRARLPVHLDLFVPAVENAIGPDALRPGEVIATRKGVSVEIDNTDAEGRLVLCDALTRAAEDTPDLLLDFATLTGAARIALGPDLPALYANDDALANDWLDAGKQVADPLWRMPLWRPYLRYLTSTIADIANGANTTHGGSITAALYLERFVPDAQKWAHVDVYSWNDAERPGKPAGGEAQGLRAAWAMLKARYGG
ncbi:MAG: leucyl aminopeptidase family protein [Pseudoxanthomonas suwonensis]|nr:leucyl aminopeptidase family protein [Pseudoxanthomonas suwonensis]